MTKTGVWMFECPYRLTGLSLNDHEYIMVQSTNNICRQAPAQDIKGAEHRNINAKKNYL